LDRVAKASFEIGEALGYEHVLLAGYYYTAVAAFLRADLDGAESALVRWVGSEWLKHEIQGIPYGETLRGQIAMARGQLDEAIDVFRHGVDRLIDDLMLGMADELLFHLIQALVAAGRRDEAAQPLEQLRQVAPGRSNSQAFLAWAEGLVTPEPADGVEKLRAAIQTFERLGRVIDEARCLMDLAKLLRACGQGDGRAEDERARELLTACGAQVYLRSSAVDAPPR